MDVLSVFFYLFAIVSTLYISHIGLYLIGANLYDVWQYRRRYVRFRRQRVDTMPGPGAVAKSYKHEEMPLISVVIPAHNEEKVIARCLESIRRSSYQIVEIIVADDFSQDRTRQIVRDYILRHPGSNLRVFRMHKNVGKGKALSTVLRRYAHGEFAMTLDADSIIGRHAIRNALSYFDDPTVAGVAANVQILYEPTVLGILQKFEHMIGYRSKKMYTLMNSEFVVGGVASTYRMDVLNCVGYYDTDTQTEDIGLSIKIASLGNRMHRMVYGDDVVAATEGVPNLRALMRQRYRWKYGILQNLVKYHHLIGNNNPLYTRSLTMYRLPMAVASEFVLLSAPFVWGYIAYMTLRQYSPILFLGAYLTITLYMLIVIWFDESLRPRMRLLLSAYAPIAYFMFYIMELVQLVAIFRCLVHSHALLRQKDTGSVWISPERVGKRLATHET